MRKHELHINVNDPAVYSQIRHVLDWCFWNLKTDKETELYTSALGAVFRNTKISQWLRNNLLREEGLSYKVGERAKSYVLWEAGWDKLSGYIHGPTWAETNAIMRASPTVQFMAHTDDVEVYRLPKGKQLFIMGHLESGASTDFQYNDAHHRLWNPLQNISRVLKPMYWKGVFNYDYDISNSAPTTLYQLAMRTGSKKLLAPVGHYIDNRDEYLSFVVETCGGSVDRDVAKTLFTSLFNGASLSTSYMQSPYKVLKRNTSAILRLQQSSGIRALLSSISYMNKHIAQVFKEDPWTVYFKQERQNLEIFRRYLDAQGTLYFLEHDGFRTADWVDEKLLLKQIEQETGLVYKMKCNHYMFVQDESYNPTIEQEQDYEDNLLNEDHLR